MASSSDIFQTPAAPYALFEARRSFKSLGLAIVLVITILVLLSLADWRFAIVAMMVVCVVVPMVLLLAWLKLTATKEMQLQIRPQRYTRISPDCIQVEFFPFAITEDTIPEPVATVLIEKSNIETIEPSRKYHTIILRNALPGTYRCFILPSSIIKEKPSLLLNL